MNKQLIQLLAEQNTLEKFKMIGYSARQLEILDENDFADQEAAQNWYYYSGPNDEKTRDFCKALLQIDKFYSESDLNYLSKNVGYNVYEHAGSFNCRHDWIKVKAKLKQDTPTKGQIKRASVKQDSRVQDYYNLLLPFTKRDV